MSSKSMANNISPRAKGSSTPGMELMLWSAVFAFLLFLDPYAIGASFCPSTWIGFQCPGCGIGRSMAAAMRFDFAHSIQLHPIGIIALIGIGVRWLKLLSMTNCSVNKSTVWTR